MLDKSTLIAVNARCSHSLLPLITLFSKLSFARDWKCVCPQTLQEFLWLNCLIVLHSHSDNHLTFFVMHFSLLHVTDCDLQLLSFNLICQKMPIAKNPVKQTSNKQNLLAIEFIDTFRVFSFRKCIISVLIKCPGRNLQFINIEQCRIVHNFRLLDTCFESCIWYSRDFHLIMIRIAYSPVCVFPIVRLQWHFSCSAAISLVLCCVEQFARWWSMVRKSKVKPVCGTTFGIFGNRFFRLTQWQLTFAKEHHPNSTSWQTNSVPTLYVAVSEFCGLRKC